MSCIAHHQQVDEQMRRSEMEAVLSYLHMEISYQFYNNLDLTSDDEKRIEDKRTHASQ